MALTETALKALKPKDKTYTKADGRGVYVEVMCTTALVAIKLIADPELASTQCADLRVTRVLGVLETTTYGLISSACRASEPARSSR